jgi:hypothetical protein
MSGVSASASRDIHTHSRAAQAGLSLATQLHSQVRNLAQVGAENK